MLDTNTLIYFFKGLGNIKERLLACRPQDLGIPVIVMFELYTGILKSGAPKKRMTALQELTQSVQVLEFSNQEAFAAAEIRRDLEKAGTPIGPYDTLIAAFARTRRATLITRNTSEFSRVRDMVVENWY